MRIAYKPFRILDDKLKKKKLDEIEYKTERELIPKGGKLYLLDKRYYESHPIVSVSVSDGAKSFKCDESDVSRTVMTPVGPSPNALVLGSLGVSIDKSKTEINCDINARLRPPIKFYMISTKDDTVSVYQYSE